MAKREKSTVNLVAELVLSHARMKGYTGAIQLLQSEESVEEGKRLGFIETEEDQKELGVILEQALVAENTAFTETYMRLVTNDPMRALKLLLNSK